MNSLKKVNKRIFCLLVSALLIVTALVGCSQSAPSTSTAPAPSTSSTTSTPAPTPAPAKTWPTKPVTCVIGYTAGGTSDILGRVLAREMEDYFSMSITPVNITGASAAIAGRTVLEAPADGYTLLSAVAHSPSSWAVLDYADIFWSDYYCLTTGTAPYVVVVAKDSKWTSMEQLVTEIRANPNKYKWSSAGFGSIGQLAGELFVQALGLEMVHIGYDGGREAVLKVMGGDVDFNLAGYSDIADLVASGDVRCLGFMTDDEVTVDIASPAYTVPSLLKMYPELSVASELRSVWGLFIPRATPPEVVKEISDAVKYAMEQDRFKEAFESRQLTLLSVDGHDSDLLCARLESLYAWGLFDTGVATKSPADYGIPRIEDFQWPPHERAANMAPWPN